MIETLTIENFKIFGRKTTFDNLRPLTILTGINGRGKSSMVQPLYDYAEGNWFIRTVVQPDINVSKLLAADRELKQNFCKMVQQFDVLERRADSESVYDFSHEGCTYDVSGKTASHAYEHIDNEDQAALLNLKEDYPKPRIAVRKDGANPRIISSHVEKEGLVGYLQGIGLLKRYYRPTDTHLPNDHETILTDTDLFEPTVFANRDNRLYRRLKQPDDNGPEEWWCLDNSHYGEHAHLEVFRASDGQHLGVSRVDRIDFFREQTPEEKKRKWNKRTL